MVRRPAESAPLRIVRNFRIPKGLPPFPILSWIKKQPPLLSAFMIRQIIMKSGSSMMIPKVEKMMSNSLINV